MLEVIEIELNEEARKDLIRFHNAFFGLLKNDLYESAGEDYHTMPIINIANETMNALIDAVCLSSSTDELSEVCMEWRALDFFKQLRMYKALSQYNDARVSNRVTQYFYQFYKLVDVADVVSLNLA